MILNIYTISFLISVVFLILTLKYLSNRKIDFRYVLFWLGISIGLIILSINVTLFDNIAKFLGVIYPPALLFAFGLIFLLAFVFYITIFISDITKRVVRLTQEIGILKNHIEELEKKLDK